MCYPLSFLITFGVVFIDMISATLGAIIYIGLSGVLVAIHVQIKSA